MAAQAEASILNADEAADLRSRMCGEKRAMTVEAAFTLAWRKSDHGVNVSAYPCPFHPEAHPAVWHVGHAPNVERLKLLARYLRFGAAA